MEENKKQQTVMLFNNVEEEKQYMELVHNYLQEIIDAYNGEKNVKDIWSEFIEDFKEDSFKTSIGDETFRNFIKYRTYKELLQLMSKKIYHLKFKKISEKAKQEERQDNKSNIGLSVGQDSDSRIESLLRYIYRYAPNATESDVFQMCQKEKTKTYETIKKDLISRIQKSIMFLEDFGIIDKNIEECNRILKGIGLKEISFIKRNVLPDEYKKGYAQLEDIGVLDSLSTEELEKYQLEDLLLMTAFWETQYFLEKNKISKTIETINGMAEFKKENLGEVNNDMLQVRQDIFSYNNLILKLLSDNLLPVKEWGVIRDIENKDNDDEIIIGINNPNFRGPLLMATSKEILEELLNIDAKTLPTYEGYLYEDYCNVMAKLYMQTSKFYRETMKDKCREAHNPKYTNLYRTLAGRIVKAKKTEKIEEHSL